MPGLVEAKELLDEIRTTWEQAKVAMDEGKSEAKALGTRTGEVEAKVNKINERLDELETKLNRRAMFSGDGEHVTDERAAEIKHRKELYFKILRKGGTAWLDDEDKQKAREYNFQQLDAREAKALALGDDTLGGFLAPPEFVAEIIKGVQLISPIRGLARIKQTTRRSVQIPVRSGVFAAQWIGETSTRTETTGLNFSMEEIPTYEMYAEVLVSEQDLEDSAFDLEAEILANATEQLAKAEGAAFVNGDSIKKPEGFATNGSVAIDLSGAAGLIAGAAGNTGGPLIACAYNLKTDYVSGARWLMARQMVGIVRQLTDSQGRYLWEPNYQAGVPSTLLGLPIVEVPDLPTSQSSSAFPIFLGNFGRGYMLVDRVDMVVKRLNEKYAEQGQIAFIVRKRVGGQVILPEAIRKLKSNNS
jgi:HK97 family phage major capsid protein